MRKLLVFIISISLLSPSFCAFRKLKQYGYQKPPAGSRVDWGDPINYSLYIYLLMNEHGGKTATDIARKYNGTFTNTPTWYPGRFGEYGVSFSTANTSDNINCGTTDDNILSETGAISISFWMYIKSGGAGGAGNLFSRIGGSGNLSIATSGTANLRLQIVGAGTFNRTSSNNSFVFLRWSHVVMTWDGSTTAANCHFYINGVEPTYVTTTNGSMLTDNVLGSVLIGNNPANTAEINGYMDNIRFFKRVITQSEIKRLYYEPFAGIVSPRQFPAFFNPQPPTLLIRNSLMKIINSTVIIKN